MILEAAVLCMALNLYHEELKDEQIDGLFAIAQVTLNRAGRDPEKVCDVVAAHKQFSWTLKPPPVEDNKPWRTAQAVARLAFYTSDFTGGATHFHALYIGPYWKMDPKLTPAGKWGSHVFYKPKVKK
jgi:spore germination cell wall hydrolase CwlJ-like protein